MKKIKSFAGYINLKPINGVIYPSSIQNIIMKDHISSILKGKFYLSPTEVLQAKYSITLNTLISNEVKVDGIIMLSTFSLPKIYKERKEIYFVSLTLFIIEFIKGLQLTFANSLFEVFLIIRAI